jgi:hypothetical protein
MLPTIHQATRAYESWLRRRIKVVEADLRRKHERMAESPFVLLRGTFYRWLQLWPIVCEKLVDAPRVLAVGDLHVENFGTWRDMEGRLVWGVNDVDEACELPYTQDLVRLATSALLAIEAEHFILSPAQACLAILEGYRASLERGGNPVVLAERRRWLRAIALGELRDPVNFWGKLLMNRPVRGQEARRPLKLMEATMPRDAPAERVLRRCAGVGSLGRPRYVALADWGGGLVAREAKAWVPSAGAPDQRRADGQRLLDRAIRVPDPFFAMRDGWIIRRLAPDCSRIEMADLPRRRDEGKLLRAMGWETGNVHLGSPTRRVLTHISERKGRWLLRAAARMARAVQDDWRMWRRGRRS